MLAEHLRSDAAAGSEEPRPLPPAPSNENRTTWLIALACSFSYALTYFWRYPIFILPADILGQPVVTIFSKKLDLQACFSLAFILGFAVGKVPALFVVTSRFFFRHRLAVLLALMILPMLVVCGGLLVFVSVPPMQVVCVFLSATFSTWIFGAMVTYLEGRRTTEIILAVLSATLIYAGNLSRGAASLLLQTALEPLAMPLVLGLVACLLACVLLYLTDRAPRPSAEDEAARCKRAPMSTTEQRKLLASYAVGLFSLLTAYALMTGLRSVRDLYSKQIFAAALGVDTAPSYFFLIADLPGALLSCASLIALSRIRDNRKALIGMFVLMACSLLLLMFSTFLYSMSAIGGGAWQLCCGAGIFVCYIVMGAPFFERFFAATRTEGTCSFLIFLSDCFGYVASVSLLLYQDFSPSASEGPSNDDELQLFIRILWGTTGAMLLLVLVALAYFVRRIPPTSTPTINTLASCDSSPPREGGAEGPCEEQV